MGLFPNCNCKGDYGWGYFLVAIIKVTMDDIFTKRGDINGVCNWPQL